MATQESDRTLMDSAKAGDADAFGKLVRRHQKRVFRLAVHLLRNTAEAEDVARTARSTASTEEASRSRGFTASR